MLTSHSIQRPLISNSWSFKEFSSDNLHSISHSVINNKSTTNFENYYLSGMLLGCLIILDLLLTREGIISWGIEAEGNKILGHLMSMFGAEKALISVKGTSLVLTMLLTSLAKTCQKVQVIICLLCFLHLIIGVIPWIYLLYR